MFTCRYEDAFLMVINHQLTHQPLPAGPAQGDANNNLVKRLPTVTYASNSETAVFQGVMKTDATDLQLEVPKMVSGNII